MVLPIPRRETPITGRFSYDGSLISKAISPYPCPPSTIDGISVPPAPTETLISAPVPPVSPTLTVIVFVVVERIAVAIPETNIQFLEGRSPLNQLWRLP